MLSLENVRLNDFNGKIIETMSFPWCWRQSQVNKIRFVSNGGKTTATTKTTTTSNANQGRIFFILFSCLVIRHLSRHFVPANESSMSSCCTRGMVSPGSGSIGNSIRNGERLQGGGRGFGFMFPIAPRRRPPSVLKLFCRFARDENQHFSIINHCLNVCYKIFDRFEWERMEMQSSNSNLIQKLGNSFGLGQAAKCSKEAQSFVS